MKKEIIILTTLLLSTGISAQEALTLEQCGEMALEYSREVTVSAKRTENARYTARSHKGGSLPNFIPSGVSIHSTADDSLGIAGDNLPTSLFDAAGQFLPNNGFAYFLGVDMNYKIGMVHMSDI